MLGIRIRIRRIRVFLGLPDPHPDPLSQVRIRILPSSSKIVRSVLFCNFFMTFYLWSLKNDVNGPVGPVFFWAFRFRIRIRQSELRIRGFGSIPKCHGSSTLLRTGFARFDYRYVLVPKIIRLFLYCVQERRHVFTLLKYRICVNNVTYSAILLNRAELVSFFGKTSKL